MLGCVWSAFYPSLENNRLVLFICSLSVTVFMRGLGLVVELSGLWQVPSCWRWEILGGAKEGRVVHFAFKTFKPFAFKPREVHIWIGMCVCSSMCIRMCASHICNWLLLPCSQLSLWTCGNLGSALHIRLLISTQRLCSGISTCARGWHSTLCLIVPEIP